MGWWNSNKEPSAKETTTSNATATQSGNKQPEIPSPALPQTITESSVPKVKHETLLEKLTEGETADSTESNLRYAAYTNRFRTILLSAHRYVAYTSDIGESFRPVAHPGLVRAAYGVSWAYILGDVSYEGYKAYLQNQRRLHPEGVSGQWRDGTESTEVPGAAVDTTAGVIPPLEDYRTVMVQRGIFQSLASMGLPAFTIHSVVKYSGKALKDVKNRRIRTWGPIGLGLGVVPFLPSIFDEPVENAVEWAFHEGFKWYGGPGYVGSAPTTGRERALVKKEKEL
ncbi:uncharacterized protein DNG_02730 [Cephalotrichum gorgonifer]|uniref:Mitochondrial fission process protein 1 n=1 Tax=Cephalotrichum gorgonifer TaxID=2041049 RepID=A0AAE8SSW6_9PEZI|nr:uncharacterized protein DNG_02730 [Cephalotrichum gorgonifer]